jgi:hypothetical protein
MTHNIRYRKHCPSSCYRIALLSISAQLMALDNFHASFYATPISILVVHTFFITDHLFIVHIFLTLSGNDLHGFRRV